METIIKTKIIGFDSPKEIGQTYINRLITTSDAKSVIKLSYKVIREATREEWRLDGDVSKVANNEARVSRGYFYEIEPVD